TAAYVYDAFGNVTKMAGAEAESNTWRFSTKPVEEVTGWSYYGFRYYRPEQGRWASRDPIGERGGTNLYGFVGNDGVGAVDILGLQEVDSFKDLIDYWGRSNGSQSDTVSAGSKIVSAVEGQSDRKLKNHIKSSLSLSCESSGNGSIDGSIDPAGNAGDIRLGRVKLEIAGTCDWSCEECREVTPRSVKEGILAFCACDCTATCNGTASFNDRWDFDHGPSDNWLDRIYNNFFEEQANQLSGSKQGTPFQVTGSYTISGSFNFQNQCTL
ncbi:MAG: RHS repeat-associated core domain-containing protein, partial [Verrucomicrobiota bacterium]